MHEHHIASASDKQDVKKILAKFVRLLLCYYSTLHIAIKFGLHIPDNGLILCNIYNGPILACFERILTFD